jgi:hypothetical protein
LCQTSIGAKPLTVLLRILIVALLASGCAGAERHETPPAPEPVPSPPPPVASVPDAEPVLDASAAEPAPEGSREPELLHFGARRPAVAFAPRTPGRRALTVMLHGMCAIPEWECPVFRTGAVESGWLLCPPGPAACQGGGAMWAGSAPRLAAVIAEASTALAQSHPEVDASRKVLIGYSLGANAALGIVAAAPGEWLGLMLVNAGLEPRPEAIRKSGVQRVALVAGSSDGSRGKLKAAADRLTRAGLEARFFSLADTGHYFDATSELRLFEPISWIWDGI